MSNDNQDSDGGMFWINLIGIGAVLTLVTIFVVFYGAGFVSFLLWILGYDVRPDR